MEHLFERIVTNARSGDGPCEGCVAQNVDNCEYVNPGLSDYDSEVMFVTDEPKHHADWSADQSWSDWNRDYMLRYPRASGGQLINYLISPLEIDIHDVWIADSVKCPTESKRDLGTDDIDGDAAFDNCQAYLENEFDRIEPQMIVPLGDRAAERTAAVLDAAIEPNAIDSPGERFDCTPPLVVAPHWDEEVQFPDKYLTAIRESQIAITECFHEISD